MSEKIEDLDTLYPGLKFKDAVYTEKNNTCVINFLFNPESFKLDNEKKSAIMQKLVEIIGNYVNLDANYISCPLDKRAIANHTYTTITNTFPAISKNFSYDDVSVEIDQMKVYVKLKLSPSIYEYATNLKREELVAEKLKESFLADFEVQFIKKDELESTTSAIMGR